MIGESLLAREGGHCAAWLRAEHPEMVPLYRPEAALDGPLPDLDEAWTCAVPAGLHYNSWIAERAVSFLERARPPFLLFVSSPDPQRRGPRGAHKITPEILAFVEHYRTRHGPVGSRKLIPLIAERFGVTVHPRGLEKALARAKKNPARRS